jgi:hypothetical protein
MSPAPSPEQLHPVPRFVGSTLDLATLPDERLQQAYAYWRQKKGTREFPSRADLQPQEMKPFLSHVMLIDVLSDPRDFVYRVYGTSISIPTGRDYTRLSVRNITPADFSDLIWRQYSQVVEARRPLLHSVGYLDAGVDRRYLRLTMPLSTDGRAIDKLFAVSMESAGFWQGIIAA